MRLYVFLFLLILSPLISNAQVNEDHSIHHVSDSICREGRTQLGVRIGLPYLIGLDVSYIHFLNHSKNYYLGGGAQSSLFVNNFNFGGGTFLGNTDFAVGLRAYSIYVITILGTADPYWLYNAGPELNWFFYSKNQKILHNFRFNTSVTLNNTRRSDVPIIPEFNYSIQIKL